MKKIINFSAINQIFKLFLNQLIQVNSSRRPLKCARETISNMLLHWMLQPSLKLKAELRAIVLKTEQNPIKKTSRYSAQKNVEIICVGFKIYIIPFIENCGYLLTVYRAEQNFKSADFPHLALAKGMCAEKLRPWPEDFASDLHFRGADNNLANRKRRLLGTLNAFALLSSLHLDVFSSKGVQITASNLFLFLKSYML